MYAREPGLASHTPAGNVTSMALESGVGREPIHRTRYVEVGSEVRAPVAGEIGIQPTGLTPETFEDRQRLQIGATAKHALRIASLNVLQ